MGGGVKTYFKNDHLLKYLYCRTMAMVVLLYLIYCVFCRILVIYTKKNKCTSSTVIGATNRRERASFILRKQCVRTQALDRRMNNSNALVCEIRNTVHTGIGVIVIMGLKDGAVLQFTRSLQQYYFCIKYRSYFLRVLLSRNFPSVNLVTNFWFSNLHFVDTARKYM